jgi:hypothetical protein
VKGSTKPNEILMKFLVFFLITKPNNSAFRESAIVAILYYSARTKNAIKGLENKIFIIYNRTSAKKRYYKYLSEIFNSTSIKVLLN